MDRLAVEPLVPTSHPPRPFGPYMLHRRLAAGGMAEVYLGTALGDAGFEKPVAIKRIHARCASDPSSAITLAAEATLAVSLTHRNIVQTFDFRDVEGDYVIVMEHVDGYDAQHVLDMLRESRRLFPIDLAAHVVAEVCRGLDYLHHHRDEHGRLRRIIHCDVSPQNVLLSFAGEVKVTDFGIAKSKERPSDAEARVIKGKYAYMSPEQALGKRLDARTDIFSTGIVLWELLVGERLHTAGDIETLLHDVRRPSIPAPSSRRSEIPGALDQVVARATALDRRHRYADARAMADALTEYLASRPLAHASRRIGELLGTIPTPRQPLHSACEPYIPQTRDRVRTLSSSDHLTPPRPPLRFDLEDGEPTVTGWRSPGRARSRLAWVGVLLLGSALAVIVAWAVHGS